MIEDRTAWVGIVRCSSIGYGCGREWCQQMIKGVLVLGVV